MMQKELAKYFQISGMILGCLLLIVGGMWWWRHGLAGKLTQTPDILTNNQIEVTGEVTDRIGWIVRRTDSQVVGMGMRAEGETVLSAAHVLGQTGNLQFYTRAGGYQELSEIELDETHDLARAKISDGVNWQAWPRAETVSTGETVVMWVSKAGEWQQITGEVRETSKTIGMQETWGELRQENLEVVSVQMENTLGDSGAPVFNVAGELVGVLVAVDLDDENISYVVRVPTGEAVSF